MCGPGVGLRPRCTRRLATCRRDLHEHLIRCAIELTVVGAQVFGLLCQLLRFIEGRITQQADRLVHQELGEFERVHARCPCPRPAPARRRMPCE